MVRETRHLWVGNLPDNIREDRIREHFKRYGRVQNVKLLGRTDNASTGVGGGGASGVCATVAFMDIKSASKAHNAEHVLDERTLTTEYYEPAAIPTTAGAPSAGSSPAGSGYSGSSSSVNSAPAPTSTTRYHPSGGEDSTSSTCPIAATAAAPATWRGTNDSATEFCRRGNTPAAYGRYQRNNSNTPYSTPPSNIDRGTPHQRWYASGERVAGAAGGGSTPSTPGGGTESGRRRRQSGSASSRSDSSSPEPSDTSRASTPATQTPLPLHNNHRTPPAQHQWASTASGRPLAICVRNLPTRSTDSSLKDGLYHEYKKHGKVVWVKVVGQNADRYAVVRFKKPSDVEKALEVSQDKLFFGCKISVAPHQSCDEDADSAKPYETDIDEYHPKATRTLFIGNLEKDVTQQQLREKFKHFGRIIEIDIKKGSSGGAGYAFCQYASISSVVEAIRAMDGEYVGGSRVKLGFGKPVATTCVWVDGLTEHTEKQVLGAVSRCGAVTSVCVDRAAGAALVHFEQAAAAGAAVRELRRVAASASAAEPDHPRLCVDYASRECQDAFYEQLEKHGAAADQPARYLPLARHDSLRFDGCGSRSRASSYGRSSSRTPRYSTVEHYDPADYAADRRYRVYDEPESSPPAEEAPYEERLQSVVVSPHRSRKHRRDSSPEDRKLSKERHRSAGAARSRSGSLGGERHVTRRRHRRRHDGSVSRAGTPLRDEPDAPPAEPRRPPRERPPLPMSLPLPKFAAQLLRTAPPAPRPMPAPAPDSPPRPPSASSSSGGSAPHSPSLEERIRSLDEKYEKWSGSRAISDTPDRTRFRHRLLEVDINEVKPSEVVRSLLAKRSVFDEDSERLEGAARAPSPSGSPRARPPPPPRPLRYQFPVHSDSISQVTTALPDPRLERPDRPRLERLAKLNEADYGLETRLRPRTPSTDRQRESSSPPPAASGCETDVKQSGDTEHKEVTLVAVCDLDPRLREKTRFTFTESGRNDSESSSHVSQKTVCRTTDDDGDGSSFNRSDESSVRDVVDMLLKRAERFQESHKPEPQLDKQIKSDEHTNTSELLNQDSEINLNSEVKIENIGLKRDEKAHDESVQNEIKKELVEFEIQQNHLNAVNAVKDNKEKSEFVPSSIKCNENKNGKERFNHHILELFHNTKIEKENIQFEKTIEKEKMNSYILEKKYPDLDKHESEKFRQGKERSDKEKTDGEKDKHKNNRVDKEKKIKDDNGNEKSHSGEKVKAEKEEKSHKEKIEKECDRSNKNHDEKSLRHDKDHHHKKDKTDKDKRKDSDLDHASCKSKKEDKHRHERSKKDVDTKRDTKKDSESVKSRKSSRDESTRDVNRKDSTDSSTSRASHESSTKVKDFDSGDTKDDARPKVKLMDLFMKLDTEKEITKSSEIKQDSSKTKHDNKESKDSTEINKSKNDSTEHNSRSRGDIEKQRHYSLDSPNVESKRKERLNSCSSLPPNIGHKRRISSQDSFDSMNEDSKKCRNDKISERRDSKESRMERHKTTKFSKGHFAKIIESKTKDDKKNQVKPPDDLFMETLAGDIKDHKTCEKIKIHKKVQKDDLDKLSSAVNNEEVNNVDFLAFLELRSSEEDERQKALRKEMKEKKRIQQLQQIQELQMQQDALQQAELMGKLKEDKKFRPEDKKKDSAREKRLSIERKSREDKSDHNKRKNRKHLTPSSDTSDSDEPKKHSIFDIIDDGPTYISMYDKVKARSCKNMQKQEEEKRQEKIKAKFCQLKQSRAKREEKKRSSWDEDSDSDQDHKKTQKSSGDNSTDEDIADHNRKGDKSNRSSIDYESSKTDEIFSMLSNENEMRNKLTRKNSRTRIMSDSSDDTFKSRSKSPSFIREIKKEILSDSESCPNIKEEHYKDSADDKIKKSSLLNLFGKSDSDDSKLKSSLENDDDFKNAFIKTLCNDFSSESESSNRNHGEVRKKHKKKQKRHKSQYSDDDNKIDNSDLSALDIDKHKISEKQRRHSSTKKEKRREKIRDSIDMDDRDDKRSKRDKKPANNNSFDYDLINNIKKEGKMEDIFGPLSDDSDSRALPNNKSEFCSQDFDPDFSNAITEYKLKDRKREKRRKEKRWLKDDENSLDVDAVSKAIEARLFAETLVEEDDRIRNHLGESIMQNETADPNLISSLVKLSVKQEKLKKECKEKRKKKKRSKEDRQSRKEHHHFHHVDKFDKSDNDTIDKPIHESSPEAMLLDIPLPNDTQTIDIIDKVEDSISLPESSSLPRLTDSPPITTPSEKTDIKSTSASMLDVNTADFIENQEIEVEQIPMPPPLENIVQDISEVPLPEDPAPEKSVELTEESLISNLSSDSDVSEDAVRSIPALEKDVEKSPERLSDSHKVEKKPEEKPRAIISQEETEDAVAALLGESFGGKVNDFANCFEEPESDSTHNNETENVAVGSDNILEEDAEEMRQAVQNLNACEMEMKPDTPVSDNDHLLIDTDTEEADEPQQDATEKPPTNVIPTTQSGQTSVQSTKPADPITPQKTKPTLEPQNTETVDSNSKPANVIKPEVKIQLARRDNVQIITSTATPVITSWTLSNNIIDQRVLTTPRNVLPTSEKNENKQKHVTANIVQIKAPPNQNPQIRPILTSARVSAPYQVINQIIRPHVSNMQPPTIKIPENHILYQKPQGVVISPRLTNDPRLLSPKASPQAECITSPRLTNVAILGTPPQSLSSVGMTSPNNLQQRSPGQVTVVRMQQPPLSPIQTMHLPHGTRTMVSPNRPNSVLVQTQGAPIHFNRLPVTPVLAPISKHMNVNNITQPNKGLAVAGGTQLIQQPKGMLADSKKDLRIADTKNDSSKIMMSPNTLQQRNTSAAVMVQNRLIPIQNATHVGNVNSPIHLNNKVLTNTVSQINEKRDNQHKKSDSSNNTPFGSPPIIHVAGISHSNPSIIQGGTKSVVCNIQETNTINRSQGSNVIHTVNPQRITPASLGNVIHIDSYKVSPSVLSVATIRPSTVLSKLDSPNVAVTTASITNVPSLLLKANTAVPLKLNKVNNLEAHASQLQQFNKNEYLEENNDTKLLLTANDTDKQRHEAKSFPLIDEDMPKCETDFEELLKDNTNEIKVTKDPENKLEVNVGNTVSVLDTKSNREIIKSPDTINKEVKIHVTKKEPTNPVASEFRNELSTAVTDSGDIPRGLVDSASKVSELVTKENTKPPIGSTKDNIFKINIPDNSVNLVSPLKAKNFDINAKEEQNLNTFKDLVSSNITINDSDNNDIKSPDESDSWAKDVNIESVIKKVDSLCNDPIETKNIDTIDTRGKETAQVLMVTENSIESSVKLNCVDLQTETMDDNVAEEVIIDTTVSVVSKRGGRSMRGKRSDKHQERIQTRQISKPPRGGASAKRGRGRTKVDKKIKNVVNQSASGMPGDVYDFHEDSGDETANSPNKTEPRPRLILTIKSPLSGHSSATPTSSLSITPKDPIKPLEKSTKEEKGEDFTSPSLNTRKSRRLQEKDGQRTSVDDVIDDVAKGTGAARGPRDLIKRRPAKQPGGRPIPDTRKSPRAPKRPNDRSPAGGDESSPLDAPREAKLPRLDPPEPPTVLAQGLAAPLSVAPAVAHSGATTASFGAAPVVVVSLAKPTFTLSVPTAVSSVSTTTALSVATTSTAPNTVLSLPRAHSTAQAVMPPALPSTAMYVNPSVPPVVVPVATIPITKPPKKMISEISAKLACVFEASAAERVVQPPLSDAEQRAAGAAPPEPADALPPAMMPVGATEATDARVRSPALPHPSHAPHRPPSAHRLADRATPILVRTGEASEAGNLQAGARVYRGGASLPRGAAHPPPGAPDLPHLKQVSVLGAHLPQHHPGAASRVTITSVPSVSPQGQMQMGEGMYPHFSHQHYQMYQQHFRATQQDCRSSSSPFTRSMEEGSEAPTPPLELRRPLSARVPRPAHSPSPADRLIMYAVGCGRSPPPAHGTSRLAGALPPVSAPGPPHASQVPREADSLQMLLRRYPVMWQGLLALKNDSAAVQMHFVGGNPAVASDTLARHPDAAPLLRIAQRMRLEPAQLDQVHRKMKLENEHCMLLALPCGRDHMDVLQQSTNLTAGFITYLQRKQAAGIVNIAPPGHHQAVFTVHIFPSCDFANENLTRIAPDLMHRVADIAHLLIVIATV